MGTNDLKVMITLNNIKRHDYSIGDYKLSESEPKICIAALEEQMNTTFAAKTSDK